MNAFRETDSPPPSPQAMAGATPAADHRTVLLVDDEEALLRLCARMLASMGFEVLAAAGGREALDLARGCRDRLWYAVVDMTMPGMGGAETFEALRQLVPTLRVLLVSGYSPDERAQELLSHGSAAYIQKPFSVQALADKLATLG